MKRKILYLLAFLFSLCLFLDFGVFRFSADNLENRREGRAEAYADGAVLVFSDASEIANLKIDVADSSKVAAVFVKTDGGEPETVSHTVKNSDLYAKVSRSAKEIAVFAHGADGEELEILGVRANPRKLNVDLQRVLLLFLLPFVALAFLIYLCANFASLKKDVTSLKRYKYLLSDLVTRDVKTKYRRSVLGILWSVLNPLLMMLVLTAVFSQVFRFEIRDFPVYYLTGYVLFNFVTESTTFSMTSIIDASGLIKKVYIPKFIFPLEKCLFAFVNLLFSLIAVAVVFLFLGVRPHLPMLLFFVPMVCLFVTCFGLSLILVTLNTFFRDVGHLWSVFITVWMYLTPIIYPISILPSWMVSVVRLNPLTHYVEYFRSVLIYGEVPSGMETLVCFAYTLVFLLAGVTVFHKKQDQFILYI